MTVVNHYEMLELSRDCTTEDVKSAYRRLSARAHPDVGGTTGMFILLQQAFEVLSDAQKRAAYDQELFGNNTGASAAQDTTQDPTQAQSQNTSPEGEAGLRTVEPNLDALRLFPPAEVSSLRSAWNGKERILGLLIGVPTTILLLVFVTIPLIVQIVELWFHPDTTLGKGFWFTIGYIVLGLVIHGAVVFAAYWVWIHLAVFLSGVDRAARVTRNSLARQPKDPFDYDHSRVATDHLDLDTLGVRVFGVPGQGLSVGRFGAANVHKGVAGETRTANLVIDQLLRELPGAKLVNGLQWPGSVHADVDHAILLGARLLLVDSKMWQDGNYWTDGRTTAYRDGVPIEVKFGWAVKEYSERFAPFGVEVTGRVLVHTAEESLTQPHVEIATWQGNPEKDAHPAWLTNGTGFLAVAREFLNPAGIQGDEVHVAALAALLELRK